MVNLRRFTIFCARGGNKALIWSCLLCLVHLKKSRSQTCLHEKG
jgi:hypothetical protein